MKPSHILLRSSWQTINIGDIAHTPGMLALLEKYLPETRVTLWPNELSPEVEAVLKARFPRLELVGDRKPAEIFGECDFALHGSGPGLIGAETMQLWAATGKPYGFGGVTLNDWELREYHDLMQGAEFLYCRDTLSLQAARDTGLNAEFFPDATFFMDLRNEAAAGEYRVANGLEIKKFACFIPRLRWTPYWIAMPQKYLPEAIAEKEAVNAAHVETDHAKMRESIVAWVRETGHRALLCPEMSYQVEMLKPYLYDPLPDEVKPHVVMRPDYWLTDEAASIYARALAVLSFECHSPIMAANYGTPAIYLRQPTDTRKGQMWRDVGLENWILEIDDSTGEQISQRLLELMAPEASNKIRSAKKLIDNRGEALIRRLCKCEN